MKHAALSVGLAALTVVVAVGGSHLRDSVRIEASPAPSARSLRAVCPEGTLPDDGVCIPVPAPGGRSRASAAVERIPRRPDRDADYARYELPAAGLTVAVGVPRGALTADAGAGAEAVFFVTPRGATVHAVHLEHEARSPVVLFDGTLVGRTVATLHETPSGGRPRRYVVLVGNLGEGPRLSPGTSLDPGSLLGVTSAAPLYLEVRWLKDDLDALTASPAALVSDEHGVAVDPRNVLVPKP